MGKAIEYKPEEIWETIKKTVREAYFLHQEGSMREYDDRMQKVLPALISSWSAAIKDVDSKTKQARLKQLFDDEIRRTEDAWVISHYIEKKVKKLLDEELDTVKTQIALLRKQRAQIDTTEKKSFFSRFRKATPMPQVAQEVMEKTQTESPFQDIASMIDKVIADQAQAKKK